MHQELAAYSLDMIIRHFREVSILSAMFSTTDFPTCMFGLIADYLSNMSLPGSLSRESKSSFLAQHLPSMGPTLS